MILCKKATADFVGTDGMEKFFPKNKIIKTGNPIRSEITQSSFEMEDAYAFFGLKQNISTVLVIGGSLGARSINQALAKGIEGLTNEGIQVIWQTKRGMYN
jgi:UDP-N-acetylglucosamine--N-acetylmuramyl-(pentapeptide) pyrophosphoryl-undecaprenol N-acetylglucosamine transferase